MSEFTPYRLSKTIQGHTNDVRAAEFVNYAGVVTTSRDGTCVLTSSDGVSTPLVEGTAFLNSVAVNQDTKTVFVGSHDSSIIACNLDSLTQTFYLGHQANVSCLDVFEPENLLASGSWDHSVRIWESPESSFALTGHTQNVWAVKFISATEVLSASADKTIKLWDLTSIKLVRTFEGHSDVVRALSLLSKSEFVSASNDGTLKIWDLTSKTPKKTLTGHSSFIYTLSSSSQYIVSGGEDRTVRVWDVKSGESLQTIVLPSISQWCVAINQLNGDFVVCSSDNTARVFTQAAERQASSEELKLFDASVKESAIGENEIDESQVADASVLTVPGKQEGQVVIVRGERNQLEAHQFSGGLWTKIGDVVGKSQASGSKKQSFDGKKYDYVFDVDIEDGQPPLKLPFNNSDNPYIVAEKFVIDNQLPSSYVTQVVQFLITNSEAKGFDNTKTPGASDGESAPRAPSSSYVAPHYSTPLSLKAFQRDPLLKALNKIASERNEDLTKYNIDTLFNSLPSSGSDLLRVALELNAKWKDNISNLLPVYDMLRLGIADASSLTEQAVWVMLLGALDGDIPKHCMLSVRGVVNLVGRADFNPQNRVSMTMLEQAVDMIRDVALLPSQQLATKPFAVALATLVLNLEVQGVHSVDFVPLVQAIGPKVQASDDPEALYRLALAIALRLGHNQQEASHYKLSWFGNASQPRLQSLVSQLKEVLTS